MGELSPLFFEFLGPPEGHLFGHHPLPLRYEDALHADAVPVGAVALVAPDILAFSVISTPGALGLAAGGGLAARGVVEDRGRGLLYEQEAVAVVVDPDQLSAGEADRDGAGGVVVRAGPAVIRAADVLLFHEPAVPLLSCLALQ